ncbi:Dolichyl-diphosphooligosaccharide--protein glycosyltransferase subunit 2 [Glycine max]|nr:Dolichyl-diphosphooligosaccharide--protein glycosyltransferase subunit 2 [Glycine max]
MATHVSHVIVAAAFLLFLLPFSFSFSISHSHRSAAINLFAATPTSLEDAYEALRVFQILGIEEKNTPVNEDTCQKVVESLASSSPLKDLFYALKVNAILKCNVNGNVFKDIASRLKATVHDASALLDIYYSIGGLVLIKDQDSNVDVLLADVDGVFQSIKVLSQSGGRWRYSSDNPESSTYAAGLALESLAGLISLASSEFDQSKVNVVKNGIVKFFDGIEKYEDETFYFDEKYVGGHEQRGSLSTTSSVVRGVTAFAAVTSGKINLPGDKILGLAKFFLGIGIPGDAKDFFNQVEISIPLILSLPETVYSLTKKGQLKAFFKLRHETKVEHIFVVGNTGKKFEKVLDFLGLVEKLFYLSGKYEIELTVGDAVMENSFLRLLGHVELDLPEAPEKAPRPPPPPVDPYSRYGPKAEITHIFRSPEKRPHQELSLAFLGLILLPFIGFLVGLLRLGVNLKNFPGSTVPATFGILFHVGIAAVLLLYVLFWLKLDLFTTLKAFGLLGAILMFVGHRILSHLAFTSAKLKSA